MFQAPIDRATGIGLSPLSVSSPKRLSQWAAENFYLSAESSYVEQRWTAYPYQPAIMDCMSNDDIQEVDFTKSARVGYTKMILAAMGYFAEHKRRNQAVWQPTDDDSDDFCKTELDPMLRDVPCMESVFPAFMQRHKDNTLKQKKFLGSILHLRGGKAAKNFRRITVDTAYLDELDGFDLDIEKEGSPVGLARKRVEGATFPKIILGSTPKLKGYSMIEARSDQADEQFLFHIPCPHCGHEHPLQWGGKDKPYGMKFSEDEDSVAQLCPSCGGLYFQSDYLSVWEQGRWISKNGIWIDKDSRFRDSSGHYIPSPLSVSFHIWTAYSPQTTWVQIVREFLSAKKKSEAGDTSELKSFVNTTLGESWEAEVDKTDEHELMNRAEDYPIRIVPMGGLVLFAGVDVQDDRFEIVVWAFGRDEEMWPIDYMVIQANPADERDWDRLDNYLLTTFKHQSGASLQIEAAAVDTGGHFTHQAYNFCRTRTKRRIFAVKGDNQPGKPVKGRSSNQDVNYRGKIIKAGVKLWRVGTDTAKDLLFGRLKIIQPGPGYVHFSKELSHEFFHQLTAEHRMMVKTARGEEYRWVKVRTRNEVLDCTIYAIFAAHMRGLNTFTQKMWDKLEEIVQPANGDLFIADKASGSSNKVDIREYQVL